MPRIAKTILPRIKKSLREKGLVTSIRRSFLLPFHLLKEYRATRSLPATAEASEFDRTQGVETDGRFGGWTYLSDLNIPSPNWIEGHNYLPIEPDRFKAVLKSLPIAFRDFVFIDFGSGKGRALLMASEYPFKRIIGLEFAPELHRTAQENILRYSSPTQKCKNIQSVNVDFTDFAVPEEPSVLFFFDPCRGRLLANAMAGIGRSLAAHPRPLYVVYVAPRSETERVFSTIEFLREATRNDELNYRVYREIAAENPAAPELRTSA